MYATVNWCGESVIELYEDEDACPDARIWRGTGVFGGGPGTAELVLRCTGNVLTLMFDGCTGFIGDVCAAAGKSGTCDPFFLQTTDAPPGACGSCVEAYDITLSV